MILIKFYILILFFYIITPIWNIKNEEINDNISDNFLQQHVRVKRRLGGLRIFWRLGRLGLRGVRRRGRMLRRGRGCSVIPIWSIINEEINDSISENFLQQHIRVKRRFGGLRIFMRLGRMGLRGARRGGRMFGRGRGGNTYGNNNMYGYNNYYGNNYYGNNWG
uniref:Uncharacterized protein n=1 Tax=Strongyloides venezuelensis TaxID=75913 RepID=A0A0K0FC85_STRVS